MLLALAAPAPALASPGEVIQDCARDGDLDGKYSNADLRKAADNLPSDLDEYSDCRAVIASAITGGSDKGKGRHNGPGGGAATPAERRARSRDRAALDDLVSGAAGKPRVRVGGKTVQPGSNGIFNLASAADGLPLPLLLALVLTGLLAACGALVVLRRRVPALSNLPLPRVKLPRVPLPRLRR